MCKPGIDEKRFADVYEKQANTYLCWAAVARIVMEYHQIRAPTQQGIEDLYHGREPSEIKTTEQKPPEQAPAEQTKSDPEAEAAKSASEKKKQKGDTGKFLEARGFIESPVVKPAETNNVNEEDLHESLKNGLTKLSGPWLCGIKEHRNAKWNLRDGKEWVFKHALLITGYDPSTREVTLADPGRPETVKVQLAKLVSGFPYVDDIARLGPTAREQFAPGSLPTFPVKVRLFKASYFLKPSHS